MQTFCTIISFDFLPYARVLFSSLNISNVDTNFHVLITDNGNIPTSENKNLKYTSINDILKYPYAELIEKKYSSFNSDTFRWALKPVYISFLLENEYDKVIYLDPDIFFTGDYSFLFKELNESSVLLTPHWRDPDPQINEDHFITLFKHGLFNAGFIGASKNGLDAIKWWAEVCHYKMDKDPENGFFDDQRYLDAMPVLFPNTKILQHKGCNLSFWNMAVCKREIVNGQLLINRQYKPVFIHFTKDTIINIKNRNDYLLNPYLEKYEKALHMEGIDLFKTLSTEEFSKYDTMYYKVKHKLRLRTRFKQFLFQLSKKL